MSQPTGSDAPGLGVPEPRRPKALPAPAQAPRGLRVRHALVKASPPLEAGGTQDPRLGAENKGEIDKLVARLGEVVPFLLPRHTCTALWTDIQPGKQDASVRQLPERKE